MTPEEIEDLVEQIVLNVQLGVEMGAILAPEIIPFVLLGKALDNTIPGLAGIVTRWVEGNPPTAEEKADLKKKLSVLSDPEAP